MYATFRFLLLSQSVRGFLHSCRCLSGFRSRLLYTHRAWFSRRRIHSLSQPPRPGLAQGSRSVCQYLFDNKITPAISSIELRCDRPHRWHKSVNTLCSMGTGGRETDRKLKPVKTCTEGNFRQVKISVTTQNVDSSNWNNRKPQ